MALISQPTNNRIVDENGNATPGWFPFFSSVFGILSAITMSGTTPNRPTKMLWTGRPYFDTTLGLPIFYKTVSWVKADGTAA